jgi:cytochrome c peroxidase
MNTDQDFSGPDAKACQDHAERQQYLQEDTMMMTTTQPSHQRRSLSSYKAAFRHAAVLGAVLVVGVPTIATLQAQTAPTTPVVIPSLKTVAVPGPTDTQLAVYVRDKAAAIRLGKALFWDVKVGSDNKTACASCHFQAGADNRITNQLDPGLLGKDRTFQLGAPNYLLKASDFPLTKYNTPDPASLKIADVNDPVSSQGVYTAEFAGVGSPAGSPDVCTPVSDAVASGGDGFHRDGLNTRRVEPRNSPTVINAVYNFRNFWDGRGNNVFNGGDPFGLRNPNIFTYQNVNGVLTQVAVALPSSSLASQASGPPLSATEMSCNSRPFVLLGRKLLPLVPLSSQQIDATDSVLGSLAAQQGLKTAPLYQDLIKTAFQPGFWESTTKIDMPAAEQNKPASMDLTPKVKKRGTVKSASQMELNFPLFFSVALQLYQSTLVSNDAPFDRFAEGNSAALTPQQQNGLALFKGQGRCVACHGGAEFTNASFANVLKQRIELMPMANAATAGNAVYDAGFYNIGVRPTANDIGVGGSDPFGNPLSETRMVQAGKASLLGNGFDEAANPVVGPTQRVAVDGAFKTPGLRNVELTGPYMHNGGKSTLKQVVDFYNRGGDFADQNRDNLAPDIQPLGLTETQKDDLVAFLLSLTDDRVKLQKAPFDHPSICLPNGHKEDAAGKLVAESKGALEAAEQPYRCIAANGAGGAGASLAPFMGLSPFAR